MHFVAKNLKDLVGAICYQILILNYKLKTLNNQTVQKNSLYVIGNIHSLPVHILTVITKIIFTSLLLDKLSSTVI